MKKWITIPALLVAGGASAVLSSIVMDEAHEMHGAPQEIAHDEPLSIAVVASGPFGLVFNLARLLYYSLRDR